MHGIRGDPYTINSVTETSPRFLSLVDFLKEGNKLNLKAITSMQTSESADEWIYRPIENNRSHLSSSNEEILKASLRLLQEVVYWAEPPTQFDFLQREFFALLPQTFNEHDVHVTNLR
ncbi:hypothetical protein BLNAU_21259 [Blattamonas nauphoetae]|uniref:Uncharacterized protein n=1 Tax=Blattamonas nauphoetae TaxID=2049346 RepID=A0ABQ9WWD7_9EUKA|nr:hypothetical protein BLNAU_21259 [Blattamonas nauphoetae]